MKQAFFGIVVCCLFAAQAFAAVPPDVLAKIKSRAAQQFPDDYSTQRYVIQTQSAAYEDVQSYSDASVPQSVLAVLKQKAKAEFPLDFSTQKYVLDTQCNAYRAVKQYRAEDVPSDVLARVKRNAAEDFPSDYATQKYVIDDQIRLVSKYKLAQQIAALTAQSAGALWVLSAAFGLSVSNWTSALGDITGW